MADPITDEFLRNVANYSWAAYCKDSDLQAIAAELLAARADLREAVELLRAFRKDRHTIADWEPIWERADELVMKHKETP